MQVDKLNADGLDCGNLGLRRCQRGLASDPSDPCAFNEEAQVVFEETAGSAVEWANGDVSSSGCGASCINPSDFTTKDDFLVSCTGNPEQASLRGLGCVRSFATYTNYDAVSGIAVFTGTGWKKFDAPADWLCAEGSSSLGRFEIGEISFTDFIAGFRADAAEKTNQYRVGGLVFLWIAAYGILSPIASGAKLVDRIVDTFACIPFVGPVIDGIGDAIEGVGLCITCGLACACAVPCGLIVMSFTQLDPTPS